MAWVWRALFSEGEAWGLWHRGISKALVLRVDVRAVSPRAQFKESAWPKPLRPLVRPLGRQAAHEVIDGGSELLVEFENEQLAIARPVAFIAPWSDATFPAWRIGGRPRLLDGDRDPWVALSTARTLRTHKELDVFVAGLQTGAYWQASFEAWLARFVRRSVLDAFELAWPEANEALLAFLRQGGEQRKASALSFLQGLEEPLSPVLKSALDCAFQELPSLQRAFLGVQAARAVVGLTHTDSFDVLVRNRLLRYCWAASIAAGAYRAVDAPFPELHESDAQVWFDALMESGSMVSTERSFSSALWLD